MTQTILTLNQLLSWKLNGFVQLDLFPEELEQAKREQSYAQEEAAWIRYTDSQLSEGDSDFILDVAVARDIARSYYD